MSERNGFEPGVPAWVDSLGPDPRRRTDFYGSLFGWEFGEPGPMPNDGEYFVARLRGHEVAGIGSSPPAGNPQPGWSTYVQVESADDAARAAVDAGGSVVVEPFDVPPAGRIAVLADPGGAVICAWTPGDRPGAELVNEPGAWSMSALSTSDPGAVAPFYGAVFRWETDVFEMGDVSVTLFRLPGFVGGEPSQPVPRDLVAIVIPPGEGDAGPSRWNVDFWIADVDAAAATAASGGGQVLVEPYELPGFRQAVLADPGGAVFTVSQLMLGP
jgi:predicted enzyme related to lactoylglutathione lyase